MQKSKVACLAGATLLATTGGASADGMVSLKDAPVVVAPSWSGPYFGGSVGFGHNSSDNNYSTPQSTALPFLRTRTAPSCRRSRVSIACVRNRVARRRILVDIDWSDIDRGFAGNEFDDRSLDKSSALVSAHSSDRKRLLFATARPQPRPFRQRGLGGILVTSVPR